MKKSIIFFILLFTCFHLFCQDSSFTEKTILNAPAPPAETPAKKAKSNGDFMLGLNVGIPFPEMRNAIKNNMGNLGFGISLIGLLNPFSLGHNDANVPIHIGLELGYTYYGRFKTPVNIGGNSGDYKTSYGIATTNAIVRFRPAYTHRFTPFADVFAGGNYYLSTIKQNLSFIESSLNIPALEFDSPSSASFSRGFGAGFTLGKLNNESQPRFVCRVTYNVGSPIKYVVRDSLKYDAGANTLTYEEGRAAVKYILVQIGIGF